ncbi:MAG: EamA family transporter, partial [Cardiobacterium sp.]
GILGLVGNFWLFSTSLLYLSAAASQVLAQISPFILLFAGIVVLKEPLRKNQIIGAAILMFGILLFFNRELPQIFAGGANHQMLGITLSLLGCFSWAAYGLVQKMLLRRLTAPQILFVFYCGCALFAAPFANWSELGNLNGYQWLCLFYCCINTPIAYGAFAEALNHWEVGKVSTTITLVPLFTIAFAALAHWLVPAKFAAPDLNLLAALGAALVVTGAICSVLNRRMVRK